jgi:hypothetical protein
MSDSATASSTIFFNLSYSSLTIPFFRGTALDSCISPKRLYEFMSLTSPTDKGLSGGTTSSPVPIIDTTGFLNTSISIIPSPASAPISCGLSLCPLSKTGSPFLTS